MKKASASNAFQCRIRECSKICSQKFPSNMHIITIFEKENTGKTAMLCALIDTMKSINCFYEIEHKKRNSNAKDKTYIFELKGTGKKVGITTTGDYCLAKEFDWMQQYDCDLYVCASHLDDSTLHWLLNRTEQGVLLRMHKDIAQREDLQTICNTKQAVKLFEIIKTYLAFRILNP